MSDHRVVPKAQAVNVSLVKTVLVQSLFDLNHYSLLSILFFFLIYYVYIYCNWVFSWKCVQHDIIQTGSVWNIYIIACIISEPIREDTASTWNCILSQGIDIVFLKLAQICIRHDDILITIKMMPDHANQVKTFGEFCFKLRPNWSLNSCSTSQSRTVDLQTSTNTAGRVEL